jgi:hypothetical protein
LRELRNLNERGAAMNKVINFGLAVLPVLAAIYLAQVIPNPLAMLKKS